MTLRTTPNDGLTDAELRATPVPVTVPIPIPVVTGGLTDAELRAAPVPVTIPTPVPVTFGTPVAVTVGPITVVNADNTVLFSGVINAVGPGAAMDITGYTSISVQLDGVWAGNIGFESSNDGLAWDGVLAMSRDDVALQDSIDQDGLFSIKASGKYLRYRVANITGSTTAVILGKTVDTLSPADKLSFAMDKQLNMPLFTETSNPEKRDIIGASIPSDAPAPILWTSVTAASAPITIDTTGYQTVIVQKVTAGVVTPTVSNDGFTFVGTTAVVVTSATAKAATIPTAAGVYAIPVTARYLRLTGPATLVTCIIYLRQQPLDMTSLMLVPPYNLAQVGGTTVVTTGVSGMIAVGGNIASGTAPTAAPVLVAGVDSGQLKPSVTPRTRTLKTDPLGRLVPSNSPFTDVATLMKSLNPDTSMYDVIPGFIKDVSNVNGVLFTEAILEVLGNILAQLKVLNFQMHELPGNINTLNPQVDDLERLEHDLEVRT
jgi:hypothetical protein